MRTPRCRRWWLVLLGRLTSDSLILPQRCSMHCTMHIHYLGTGGLATPKRMYFRKSSQSLWPPNPHFRKIMLLELELFQKFIVIYEVGLKQFRSLSSSNHVQWGVQKGPLGAKHGSLADVPKWSKRVQNGHEWSICVWPFWAYLHRFEPFQTKINFRHKKHKVLLGHSTRSTESSFVWNDIKGLRLAQNDHE